jgi:hypothetical protein
LAAYIGVESTRDLLSRAEPEASLPGIVLAGLSLVVMPVLARAKRKVAPVLGSRAAVSEANQTSLCALLWAVLLSGWPPTPCSAGGGPTRPLAWASPLWPPWRVCGPGERSRWPTLAATNQSGKSSSPWPGDHLPRSRRPLAFGLTAAPSAATDRYGARSRPATCQIRLRRW